MIAREIKNFIKICKMGQQELKGYLRRWLKSNGYKSIVEDGYIYAKGSAGVVVTAHMDTVHEKPRGKVKDVLITYAGGKTAISSKQGIGGDDRCGVYMIQQLVEKYKLRPTIVFCEDEEIGGVGSGKLCKNKDLISELSKENFFIELDRAHDKDLVYYDDMNDEFHNWCEKVTGYFEATGSFSDISNLCPDTGISGVNISCGYYKAHTTEEFVIFEEMIASTEKAAKLIKEAANIEPFEYVEWRPSTRNMYSNSWYDNEDMYLVEFYDENGIEDVEYHSASSDIEAIGYWAMEHPTLSFEYIIACESDWDRYIKGKDVWSGKIQKRQQA